MALHSKLHVAGLNLYSIALAFSSNAIIAIFSSLFHRVRQTLRFLKLRLKSVQAFPRKSLVPGSILCIASHSLSSASFSSALSALTDFTTRNTSISHSLLASCYPKIFTRRSTPPSSRNSGSRPSIVVPPSFPVHRDWTDDRAHASKSHTFCDRADVSLLNTSFKHPVCAVGIIRSSKRCPPVSLLCHMPADIGLQSKWFPFWDYARCAW